MTNFHYFLQLMQVGLAWKSAAKSNEKLKYETKFLSRMPFIGLHKYSTAELKVNNFRMNFWSHRFSQIWTNNCQDFCPVVCFTAQVRNPDNFSFIFWEKTMTSYIHSEIYWPLTSTVLLWPLNIFLPQPNGHISVPKVFFLKAAEFSG